MTVKPILLQIILYSIIDSPMEADRPKTIFVVEHMEPYLFEWCFYEYRAMVEYLREFNTGLWITNASVIIEYKAEHKE